VIDRSLLRLFQSQRDLDGGIAGFGIRVTAGAAKALVLTYRNDKLCPGSSVTPPMSSSIPNSSPSGSFVSPTSSAGSGSSPRPIAALGGRIHPQIAWAKLEALVEGAALATRQLWR